MIREENMTEFERNCYGITEQDIREDYLESITARLSGIEMVVAGILSDCQEFNLPENVRKQLNVAKFILFDALEKRTERESR
jgi:hypothetical protein